MSTDTAQGLLALLVLALFAVAVSCSQTQEYTGSSVDWTARVGPPGRGELRVDGVPRCVGESDGPLQVRVHDCTQVEQVGGGMCRAPEVAP